MQCLFWTVFISSEKILREVRDSKVDMGLSSICEQ